MRRLLVSFALIAFLVAGRIVIGQERDQNHDRDDPFFDRSDRGETIHVFPGHEAAAGRSVHGPYSFAPPSRRTAVYPASYGSGTLTNHGGPQIAGAGFEAIYWNSQASNATQTSLGFTALKDEINSFIVNFSDGGGWDNSATDDYAIVQQYGTSATQISPLLSNSGFYVDSQATLSTIQDSQIQSYLAALFNAGKARATNYTIYGVYFPPGMKVSLQRSSSCVSFCGYHGHFAYNGIDVRYAAFPYLNCSACQLSNLTVADMLTIVTSHEIRESVTDPNLNSWYDRSGYEADDKCAWHNLYQMKNGGFWVQPEYSRGGLVGGVTYPGPGCVVPNR
jgi:hypothetical protein